MARPRITLNEEFHAQLAELAKSLKVSMQVCIKLGFWYMTYNMTSLTKADFDQFVDFLDKKDPKDIWSPPKIRDQVDHGDPSTYHNQLIDKGYD